MKGKDCLKNGDGSYRFNIKKFFDLSDSWCNVLGFINKKFIQKGLTEAMTNVSNHAYPDEHLNNLNFKDLNRPHFLNNLYPSIYQRN